VKPKPKRTHPLRYILNLTLTAPSESDVHSKYLSYTGHVTDVCFVFHLMSDIPGCLLQ